MKNEIELKAKNFAIKAHKGQVRKSEKEKPMVIHPIDVAQILKKYEFDASVIAAGYLHDVVEDTSYELRDITAMFGEDIASLVWGASEMDKNLSWEERKQTTIEKVKKLDFRHKAVVCADKISNLEDFKILSEIKGSYDYSAFKRGFEQQKWYYTEIYNSLIVNEDINHPMFVRLKELIDYIFYDINDDDYVKNVIFNHDIEEYQKLIKFHYRNSEVFKLKKLLSKEKPYVIEFSGTPRTGKTSLINNLKDFFKKKGFVVDILEEFTTSKEYKSEISPRLKDDYKNIVYKEIPENILKQLDDSLNKGPDIIIIDRALFDRLVWVDRLYLKKGLSTLEYNNYKNLYIPLIKEKIDLVITTYTDSLTCIKRDYFTNLSLEKRSFLNQTNVDEYNKSLLNIEKIIKNENIKCKLFDTTNQSQREISFLVLDFILENMKKDILEKLKEEFN